MCAAEKYNLTSEKNYSIYPNYNTAAKLTMSDSDITSNNKLLSL